jgi:hypothetical protein
MPSRLAQLTARRRALVLESQALRAQLGASGIALRNALSPAQIAHTVLGSIRRHPGIAVGAAVALVALRPRRLWKLAALGSGALAFALRAAPVLSAALRFARSRRARAGPR